MTKQGWHDLIKNPNDLPEEGERVIFSIDGGFVGEGWINERKVWYRYCDLDPVETFMHRKVDAWRKMPHPYVRKGE